MYIIYIYIYIYIGIKPRSTSYNPVMTPINARLEGEPRAEAR